MSNFNIDFNIRVTSQLQKELRKSVAQTRKVNTSLKQTRTNMRRLLPTIRQINQRFGNMRFTIQNVQFLFAAIGATFFAKRIVSESIKVQNSLTGLSSVARNLNQDVNETLRVAKELAADGLIPLQDVSRSLKNLLASGLDLPKAIKLFKAFRQSAAFNRQGQLELSEAVSRATDGFKNRLSILVDNAGLTKNLSQIEKEYARSTGKSTKNITEQQRSLILANGLIKESAVFQGDYNRLLGTFSGALSEVQGRFRFFIAALGDSITKSQTARDAVGHLAGIIQELTLSVKANQEQIGVFFVGALLSAALAIVTLVKGLVTLRSVGLQIIFLFKDMEQSIADFSNTVKNGFVGVISSFLIGTDKAKDLFNALQKTKSEGIFSDEQKKAIAKDIEAADALLKIIEDIQKGLAKGIRVGPSLTKGGPGGQSVSDGGADIIPGSGDILSGLIGPISGFVKEFEKQISQFFVGMLQGKEGFLNTVGGIPGVGPFLKELGSQNKEEVRENIRAWAKAIPEFVIALAENIPVFIEELIAAIPMVIAALVEAIIEQIASGKFGLAMSRAIVNGLIRGLKTLFENIFKAIGSDFVKSIISGAGRFVEEIIRGAGKFIKKLIDGITGQGEGGALGGGGILGTGIGPSGGLVPDSVPVLGKLAKGGTVGKIPRFANGGTGITGKIPGGFPNDTFNAKLQSGETVITQDTTRKLDNFLDRQTGGTQVIQVRSDINEKTLIDTIIRLKKNGQLEV